MTRTLAVMLAAACGGRTAPVGKGGPSLTDGGGPGGQGDGGAIGFPDGSPEPDVESLPDQAPPPGGEGALCDPTGNDGSRHNRGCESALICAAMDATHGLCLLPGCRVDLPTLTINEDTCHIERGSAYVCIDIDGEPDPGEPYHLPDQPDGQNADLSDNVCVRKCTPSDGTNECDTGVACAPETTRYHFAQPVCFAAPCESGRDCPVTVGPPRGCASDRDCSNGAFCAPDRGACAIPGVCDAGSGICGPGPVGSAFAAIGDPCRSDIDCPVGGACLSASWPRVSLSEGDTAPRNGYCTRLGCRFSGTLSGRTCPSGSACNNFYYGGGCQRLCDPADPGGCRGNDCDPARGLVSGCDWFGDFDCWDWGGWIFTIDNLPVVSGSDGQVCDYIGPVFNSCQEIYDQSSQQGCPEMAPTGNPVSMDCRDAETAAPTLNDADSAGHCLDLTSSGPPCSDYGRFCNGECVDTGGGPCP
jgi:hypothetical protein